MTSPHLRWPSSGTASLLAALTSWVALWAWAGFVESPSGFLIPVLGGCLLIAGTGMMLRSARVPALLVTLAQASLLFVWVNRSWAAAESWGGWLPTAQSLAALGDRMALAGNVAQQYAAPVPDDATEIYPLLIVAGLACAVLVDLLACGLRRVPLAGLPLLAVYTAPVSILEGGVPWWAFAVGALSFLFLLANDEGRRLSGWGRQISSSSKLFDTVGTAVSTETVRASARKIGFTATGLALVVPLFIPTFSAGLFGGSGPGGGGGGDAVAISNPIVDLRRDLTRGRDVPLLRVTTQDRDPSYLRTTVLDEFDGKTWKPSGREIPVEQRASGPLPRPPGLGVSVDRSEVDYQIRVSPEFRSNWLPTPYPVSSITARGDWRYDVDTFDFISAVRDQTTAGIDYQLTAIQVRPTARELANSRPAADDVYTPYTALPDSVPSEVYDLARQVTDGAPSRFEKAVQLQEWFRQDGGFTYSLDRRPGNGNDDLIAFLTAGPDGRVGYCEQFAASMAVMGRTLGIPSRVAVGFLRPDPVGPNEYVFSAHDLHAWPEMYFEGAGWVRFEPTPQDRATAVPGYTTAEIPSLTPDELPSSAAPNRPQDERERPAESLDPGAASGGSGSSGNLQTMLFVGLGTALVLALLALPRALRAWVRRRRWTRALTPTAVAEAAWSELRDSATDLRLPWDDTVTLRTRARSLAASFGEHDWDESMRYTQAQRRGPAANPDATHALERLVTYVERARFARTVEPVESVVADVELCVMALRDGVNRKRRLRATWLPTSLIANRGADSGLGADRSRPMTEAGVDHAV